MSGPQLSLEKYTGAFDPAHQYAYALPALAILGKVRKDNHKLLALVSALAISAINQFCCVVLNSKGIAVCRQTAFSAMAITYLVKGS